MAALVKTLGLPEATIAAGPSQVFDPNMVTNPKPIIELQLAWLDVGGILTYSKPINPSRVYTDKFVKLALAGKA
jgi:hypothetical protein